MTTFEEMKAAIIMGDAQFVSSYLQMGADANAMDKSGYTLLDYAIGKQSKSIIDLLVKAGADNKLKNAKFNKIHTYENKEQIAGNIPNCVTIAQQSDTELIKINSNRHAYPVLHVNKVTKELKKRGLISSTEASYHGEPIIQENDSLRCPKCGSTQLSADRKGFGFVKAGAGALLTGGIGLLGGFIGSRKVLITCLKCGKHWKAGS